jgi:hypothetical protein
VIDDVIVKTNGAEYCFTDGCGQISMEYASQISKMLSLEYVPSVFQIRFRGAKGIVVVNTSLPEGAVHLRIRPSMIKFPSSFNVLEILDFSRRETGYLNRQVLNVEFHRIVTSVISVDTPFDQSWNWRVCVFEETRRGNSRDVEFDSESTQQHLVGRQHSVAQHNHECTEIGTFCKGSIHQSNVAEKLLH